MTSPLYKYSELRWAKALVHEGSVKVGTLSEYRGMEGLDAERGDRHEGELTLQSPAGRHAYGGETLPPPLRNPNIYIGPGAFVVEGQGAVTIHSKIPDLFIYCTSEAYDLDVGRSFANGVPMGCVRINQPEQFFLAVDAALRTKLTAGRMTLRKPKWDRCVYEDRLYDWEREDVPAAWLLKPAKLQKQREIRVRWDTDPMQPLEFIILKVPAIIPHCTLIHADPEADEGDTPG